MTDIKVEIGQYRAVNKDGALKGFFSLVIYPNGQKIRSCRYFISGDSRWWSFPCEEIKPKDGGKTEYIPYVSYFDKEYLDKLKSAVLDALESASEDKHDQTKRAPRKANSVPSKASFGVEEAPF